LSAILALKTFSPNPIIEKIIENLSDNFTNTFVFLWIPSHCGIRENEYVDQLAKNSITKSKDESFRPLAKDFRQKVNVTLFAEWEKEWRDTGLTNKLKSIKTDTTPWKSIHLLNRKDSIVLSRLRIGHTFLTHEHIFNNRPPPKCTCNEKLTIDRLSEK
jgi:hypothetical protein